ncbi:MAG: MCE family protein [Mailhella sp.]|nr:MCE family protein [Mailhella sp.]
MSERSSKILTGLFVLGAAALMCAGALVLGAGSLFRQNSRFVLFFDESARSLSKGSSVYFNGVAVGKVRDVSLEFFPDTLTFKTPIVIELNSRSLSGEWLGADGSRHATFLDDPSVRERLIRNGLRASLTMESIITGQLAIVMEFKPDADPVDFSALADFAGLPQLPTAPSALGDLLSRVNSFPINDIINEALNVLRSIDKSISDAEIGMLSKETAALVKALKLQTEKFGTLQDSGKATIEGIGTLASDTGRTLADIAARLDKTLNELAKMGTSARTAMDKMGRSFGENSSSAIELSQTLKAVRDAAYALSQLANMIETEPNSLIFGRR